MSFIKRRETPLDKQVEKELESRDKIAREHYDNCKNIIRLLEHRWEGLSPRQNEHFHDMKDFILGYETGKYKSVWEFYKRPRQVAKEWNDLDEHEHKAKLAELTKGWRNERKQDTGETGVEQHTGVRGEQVSGDSNGSERALGD